MRRPDGHHRAFSDRRHLHHRPRARGPRPIVVTATIARGERRRARRMRALWPLRRDRRRRGGGHRGDAARDRGRADPRGACRPRCRRAPPATRSIARYGTSTPSDRASAPMSTAGVDRWPPVDDRLHDQPRTRPKRWREAAAKAAARPILKVKFGGEGGDLERIARRSPGRAGRDPDRRRQRRLDRGQPRRSISRPAPRRASR